jgi:hypothetical protein
MIINLLLIALICYYFKRKYENLEIAQNEQAKVLYQLLQQNSSPKVININDILEKSKTNESKYSFVSDTEKIDSESHSDSDSDSDNETDSNDSDSDNDSNTDNSNKYEIKTKGHSEIDIKNNDEEIKTINLDEKYIDLTIEPKNNLMDKVEKVEKEIDTIDVDLNINLTLDDEPDTDMNEKDYSKMSIKQLKEILSVKGINPTKMKKNEMIELIEKSSVSIDE